MDGSRALQQSPSFARMGWRPTSTGMVVGLTLLALALRLTGLNLRPFWLDEAFSSWFSDHSFHYLWTVLPTYETHPPFYYSVLKLWRMLAGDSHVAMRGLSVLLGTLTVPVAMAIAFEQERQEPSARPLLRAGLAGFLVACSPLLMVIGQEARPYPLLTFGYAIAILALLRLMRQLKAGAPGSWLSWLLLGASAELTLWSHGLGLLYGVSLGLALLPLWLSAPMSRARLVRGIITATIVGLLYLPCLIMMASRAQDWGTNWLHWHPGLFLPQLLALYTVPVEALSVGSAVAALAMVLLIKRALVSTYISQGWNSDRTMLLLWLGPPILAALISALFVPVFLARTLSATLIPAYLVIAAALARSERPRERRIITAAICITLLPTAIVVAFHPAPERWDRLASFLSRNVAARDQVWLYPSDSALPLAEVGQKTPGTVRLLPAPFPTLGVSGPVRAGWPAMVSLTREQAEAIASDPALKRVAVVWLVTRQAGIFDPNGDLPRALAQVRRPGTLQQWGYITVQPYYSVP